MTSTNNSQTKYLRNSWKSDGNSMDKHGKYIVKYSRSINDDEKKQFLIDVIKTDEHIRTFLTEKYRNDHSKLEQMFCDPKKIYMILNDKIDKVLQEENEDIDFSDHLAIIDCLTNNKLKGFTSAQIAKKIDYHEKCYKYRNLVGCFWSSDFADAYTKLDQTDFERLAEIELADKDIVLKPR